MGDHRDQLGNERIVTPLQMQAACVLQADNPLVVAIMGETDGPAGADGVHAQGIALVTKSGSFQTVLRPRSTRKTAPA